MLTTSKLAEIAGLVGDPARAAMLVSLMDGRALTATELAGAAGVTPQTASTHLSRMTDAGLLAMERQGRHRYHRLASPAIARMLEGLMAVAADRPGPARFPIRTGPRDRASHFARTCYDHLAGKLAVAIADRLVERGHVELSLDGGAVTASGLAFLQGVGVDPRPSERAAPGDRLFCRPCLDWSERRPHLAGALGSTLLSAFLSHTWLRRTAGARTVQITPAGRRALDDAFAFDAALWAGDGIEEPMRLSVQG